MKQSKCKERKKVQGKGLLDKVINKLPFEVHIPKVRNHFLLSQYMMHKELIFKS